MVGREAAGGLYAAFLSYSHKDAADAAWLHRRLESYRIPRRLVGRDGAHGAVPARLVPIFRDREELPAAGDLSDAVRAALARSQALVVLCSPSSAASPWVAKEVAAFRELHPERPVLAAIVAGEPPHCFPTSFADGGTEPLAADLRPEGDGRRLGVLKLIAGLAGVGVDALVQRDAQRRIRRVTAVTAAALAAMLAMAIMTTLALTARAEAQRQRAQAEGLVEFMLTDLRDRLRGVGRLDVLTAVNERALDYYGERGDLTDLPADSLARRARIFQAMGEDSLHRDDVAAALAAFREAARTTSEQVTRNPKDERRLFEHARSLSGLGMVYEAQEDWDAARRYYSAFEKAADRLVRRAPANPEYLMKAASAAINLGNIDMQEAKDYAAAERAYRKAVDLLARAAQARRAEVYILLSQANALGWLADSFYYRDMWRDSLDARQRQYAIVASLRHDHPDNHEIGFRFAAANRGLAYSLLKTGDQQGARSHLITASDIARRQTLRDPENEEWRSLHEKLAGDLRKLAAPLDRSL